MAKRLIEKRIKALEKIHNETTNCFSKLWIWILIKNEKSKLKKYKTK